MLILMFTISMLTTSGLMWAFTRPRSSNKKVKARLATLKEKSKEDQPRGLELAARATSRLSIGLLSQLRSNKQVLKLEKLILHSGSALTVTRTFSLSAVIALILSVIAQHYLGMLLVSLLAGGAGGFAPIGYLKFQKGRRLNKFNQALPDAIDLMARALRAGHSVGSSIEVISQQSAEPLASEFELCFQEQKFGIPFRETLLSMAERVPCADLDFFVTAVLVQKETGGDLTEILERTTKLIRDRVRIQGEVRSHTAQGRLTGWILSALPVALLFLMNFISPGYSNVLFTDPLGKMLLCGGGIMIAIGSFIISKIVDIKV